MVVNETPPSNPPVWQDIIKKGSDIMMVVRGSPISLKIKLPILLEIKLPIFKVFSNTWHDRPSQQVHQPQ